MSTDDGEDLSLFDSYERARESRKQAEDFFNRANPETITPVYLHGLALYEHIKQVVTDVTRSANFEGSAHETVVFHTPLGRIAIGGPDDDIYEGPFASDH